VWNSTCSKDFISKNEIDLSTFYFEFFVTPSKNVILNIMGMFFKVRMFIGCLLFLIA